MNKPSDYFFAHLIKTSSCWIWTGYNNGSGYGKFRIGKLNVYAHRFSYSTHKGEIPKGMFVLHKCDNPTCVNPDHLELGTQVKNLRDCVKRRRAYMGEKCALSKITAKQVSDLRNSYSAFVDEKAKLFSLSRAQIANIIHVRSWR